MPFLRKFLFGAPASEPLGDKASKLEHSFVQTNSSHPVLSMLNDDQPRIYIDDGIIPHDKEQNLPEDLNGLELFWFIRFSPLPPANYPTQYDWRNWH